MKTLIQIIEENETNFMAKAYAGVGSRRITDKETLELMTAFALKMGELNWILRSGKADGPDTAFEMGAPPELSEIYVTVEAYRKIKDKTPNIIVPKNEDITLWMRASSITEQFHPIGRFLDGETRALMTRNAYQVLGRKLKTPVSLLVCDAPLPVYDSEGLVCDVDGGTGQAVRIAYSRGIPNFHLGTPHHREQVIDFIDNYKLAKQRTFSF